MVYSQMYCSVQIEVPSIFPDILKSYAKAAIKTRPYDLLKWSAVYFRSLAENNKPPVKYRLESDFKFGCLTKGYLRVLIDLLGKGYFIRKAVIQNQWESLSLSEEELLNFLSLCRMLNWPKVHWLKLFSAMVGSLTNSFRDALILLFHLLTEDIEGGPSPIPFWMFRECYLFLAQLDCSEQQIFEDGRRMLPIGRLEDEIVPTKEPMKMLANPFIDSVIHKIIKTDSMLAPDFDNFLSYINERQDDMLKKDTSRAAEQNSKYQPAALDEMKLIEKREQERENSQACHGNTDEVEEMKIHLYADRANVLKEIGPPWSWMYQFAVQNCSEDKSFNFIENQSRTPLTSTDGSFNFENEAFQQKLEEKSTEENISESKSISSDDLLTCREQLTGADDVISLLSDAELRGKFDTMDMKSLISFLAKDGEEFLKSGGTESQLNDFNALKIFLEYADNKSLTFPNIKMLFDEFRNWKEDLKTLETKQDTVENVIDDVKDNEITLKSDTENTPIPPLESSSINSDENDIVEIFQKSGIEPDPTLMDKTISKNMILGLIEKPTEENKVDSTSASVSVSDSVRNTPVATADSQLISTAETIKVSDVEKGIKQVENVKETTVKKNTIIEQLETISVEDSNDNFLDVEPPEPYTCVLPSMPGIGRTVQGSIIEKFMNYIAKRAIEQNGMVYPRNLDEDECPAFYGYKI